VLEFQRERVRVEQLFSSTPPIEREVEECGDFDDGRFRKRFVVSWTFAVNIAFLQDRRLYMATTKLFVLGMHIFIYFSIFFIYFSILVDR
jgi:hypothetical protein